jgi:outer membrane protein OmpA-like peptidoglycan-associated protein
MSRYKFILLLFSTSTLFSFAQISKGDSYVEKGEYLKAIKWYKKATQNSTEKSVAWLKLAESYKKLNDYPEAENAYENALSTGGTLPAEAFYDYGQVLKVNNKYQEAIAQYTRYIQLKPNDEAASKALKFCREINYYLSKPIEYEVKNLDKINTSKSEFSPLIIRDKLAYVAEKASFDFVNYSVNDFNGEPYLNMYITDLNDQSAKVKTFSKKINAEFHDGPACLSADGQTLYFTRVNVQNKKDFVNTAKIFIATGHDRSWKNIQPFDYNSDKYSVAHPSIDASGTTLFFCSDMPGGYGGKDIWMSKKNGSNWEAPVNLGPDVNTTGDEMFPSIRKDGILFFASNGLPGFGGLDVYSAKNTESKWLLVRNEGLNLNSNFDDFGLTFMNDSIGYFSSNRSGGKGGDDIYSYKFTNKYLSLDGTILLTENSNDPAKKIKVFLTDENGKILDSVATSNDGYFKFKNLDAEKKYMVVVDSDDPQFNGKARYYMADKNKIIQRVTNKVGDDKFVFKNLPVDPNGLPDLYTDDDLTLAGNLLYGESPSKPIKNAKIKITNQYGDVFEETTTNELGAFAFRNIPSDQNYIISLEESEMDLPQNTKITLTSKSGKELKSFRTGEQGKFDFKILASDKNLLNEMDANDENLTMDIFGYMYDQDKKPIAKTTIRIKEDGKEDASQIVKTGENGKFNFKNLKGDKGYIFETDDSDPSLNSVKRIYIADNKGRIYKVIDKTGSKFTFKLLDSDKAAMGEFAVEDPWLVALRKKNQEKSNLTVVENIYYAFGEYKPDTEGMKTLDKSIETLLQNQKLTIELNSHTDSKSTNEFNMTLSRKRAQFAVDYIVSKGVNKKRVKAAGFGETRLLNKCENGIECSDDEHKVNRRTEIKISE